MALARRSQTRGAESFIWPGFVDALATLLMVIIFVLMVFFLIQINLAQRVSGQDQTLSKLRGEIAELANLLNMERESNKDLTLNNQQLAFALSQSEDMVKSLDAQIAALQASLNTSEDEKLDLEKLLLSMTDRAEQAEKDRDDTKLQFQAANAEIDEKKLMLAALQARLDEMTAARDAAEEDVNAKKSDILALRQSLEALRQKMGELQALLDEKEEEARLAKEATVNLTKKLNNALTSKVLELQRFRSEFFGRLRDILKDRSDIRIVGDRFVFQSEVLFDAGSADIGADGEKQLMELSLALSEIANNIPTDIDWVLQISGHTDNIPINTPRFRDNWDLSTERALSVLRYLALAGIDQDRLSAAGFGEYQPIDTADTPEARAKNRRIEVKLTTR